jgi:hypothetical protein
MLSRFNICAEITKFSRFDLRSDLPADGSKKINGYV